MVTAESGEQEEKHRRETELTHVPQALPGHTAQPSACVREGTAFSPRPLWVSRSRSSLQRPQTHLRNRKGMWMALKMSPPPQAAGQEEDFPRCGPGSELPAARFL